MPVSVDLISSTVTVVKDDASFTGYSVYFTCDGKKISDGVPASAYEVVLYRMYMQEKKRARARVRRRKKTCPDQEEGTKTAK